MKRLLRIGFILSLLLVATGAYARETDSLLLVLDDIISKSHLYIEAKERKIDSIKEELEEQSLSLQSRYDLNKQLYNEYRPYIYDSAMRYVMLNKELAEQIGKPQLVADSKIDVAFVLLGGGMQNEAVQILDSIDPSDMDNSMLESYYLCYEQCYFHMSIYVAGTAYEPYYYDMSRRYVEMLKDVTSPETQNYFALSRIYISNEDVRIARILLEDLLDRLELGSHGYAIVASTLADCYAGEGGDPEKRKKWLILSSISDVSSAIKEYVSLSILAGILYYDGDVERAYNYGTISMEDANFYNARLRRAEMSRIYPILERAYKMELDEQNQRLKIFIICISLLAFILLGAFFYIYKQTTELRKVRKALMETNEKLVSLNHSLQEANRVKEEYLGRFLSLCSSYINRLERYQSMVHNKLTAGKVEEVRIMTRSSDLINYEINEFYKGFDKAFLRLYPTFINDFNSLLRPEERTLPKDDKMLTTEMRIYALIRLGISDSASIAKFLRYSANTVYTYRHKTRLKAVKRESFDQDILNTGF